MAEEPFRDPSHVQGGFTVLWINEVVPGRVQEYLELAKDVLPFYPKYGVDLLGCWIGGIGAKSNQLFFLIDYHDMATMNRLYSDPEFVRMCDERGFQSMRSNTGWLLNPVDLSPIEFKLT
jgi:hypothetical protein